jgi:hypothetical protein
MKINDLVYVVQDLDIEKTRLGKYKGKLDSFSSKVEFESGTQIIYDTAIYPVEYQKDIEDILNKKKQIENLLKENLKEVFQLRNKITKDNLNK